MLNKSFLFGLVALVAAPLAFGAAPEPFTKTFLGIKHTCVDESTCWSENNGFLIGGNETILVYLNADMLQVPIVTANGDGVYQAWVKYVMKPAMNGIGSIMMLKQVDSKENRVRALQATFYTEKGSHFFSNNTPEDWHYVIPNSIEENVSESITGFGILTKNIGEEKLKRINPLELPHK